MKAPPVFESKPVVQARPPVSADLVTPGTRALALEAQAVAGGIRIFWPTLNLNTTSTLDVFRKPMGASQWDSIAVGQDLPWDSTEFVDTTAVAGQSYEYSVRISDFTTIGQPVYRKHIGAGKEIAPVSSRGAILLVIDETQFDATRDAAGTTIAPALARYKADLVAEGYRVLQITAPRVDVPRTRPPAADPENPTPAEIAAHSATWFNAVINLKNQIRSIWQANPDLKSVNLLGHVPVPYSGFTSPDVTIGHEQSLGAWPADIFYSTLSAPDLVWTDIAEIGTTDAHINLPGDGKFDQDALNQLGFGDPLWENNVFADVAVGRVDFAMLDTFAGVNQTVGVKAGAGETKLLIRYLDKVREYKTGQWNIQRKALFEEAFPFGEYYDTNRLTPNVGINNIVAGTVSPYEPSLVFYDNPYPPNVPPPTQYDLNNQSWLWMYTGAGGFNSRTTLQYNPNRQLRSDQFSNGSWSGVGDFTVNNQFGSHKSVFNFVYASYVGDWDYRNNLLRTIIAEPDGYGLVSMWGSRPVWDQHHMGVGEPMATSALRTWNNFGANELYSFDPNSSSTRQSVLGDVTLRQDNVKPASNVRVESWSSEGNVVRWNASPDAGVSKYYVYRSNSFDGTYTLLTPSGVSGTTFTDAGSTSPAGQYYLVRAAKLETTPGGTYWNLALGAYSAPAVIGASFQSGDRAQAVELTFSHDVGPSLASGDFVISGNRYNVVTGQTTPVTFAPGSDFQIASYNPATRTVRIVFSMTSEMGLSGVLPSGRYTVQMAAGSVTNEVGVAVDAGYSFPVGFLSGDANGDFTVNFDDLLIVAQNYNASIGSSSFSSGDFNDDGVVDFDDLLILAQRYGVSI